MLSGLHRSAPSLTEIFAKNVFDEASNTAREARALP
jgi:hypothetical protein